MFLNLRKLGVILIEYSILYPIYNYVFKAITLFILNILYMEYNSNIFIYSLNLIIKY